MTRLLFVLFAVLLSGCVVGTIPTQPSRTSSAPSTSTSAAGMQDADFAAVVKRVEPVAENMCREASSMRNCDFLILEDNRAGSPSNAFQTRDKAGRPVIIFTKALLDDMENSDEIAFVLGHETAHHIEDHLPRTNESAQSGAMVAGIIIAAAGGDPAMVQQAQEFGAIAGARAYSKQFELEADSLGTIIAIRSGFDPVRGAEFFSRLPDPGDQFLGTHPMNAERQQVVRQTAARYR